MPRPRKSNPTAPDDLKGIVADVVHAVLFALWDNGVKLPLHVTIAVYKAANDVLPANGIVPERHPDEADNG